jgi:hypothetical protein
MVNWIWPQADDVDDDDLHTLDKHVSLGLFALIFLLSFTLLRREVNSLMI